MEGLYKGIVKEVGKDAGKCNCVGVEMVTGSNPIKLKDVPILYDMASKESGKVVVPKVGDNVVLGFFGADMQQPVILGSFYDPTNKPPIQVDDKNNVMYFQTATGIKIKIDDSKDKAGIFVETKDGHKLTLEDNSKQLLTFSDKNSKTVLSLDMKASKVEIKCKDMAVTAEKSVVIKAGQNELAMNDSGIKIKATKDINLEASNLKEKSKANFNIEGANVAVKANANVDIKSNAQANFKGSITKIG